MNTQQTEIDVLKAQVKTLKRMFYGFGCLLVAGIALAATSMQGGPDVIQANCTGSSPAKPEPQLTMDSICNEEH